MRSRWLLTEQFDATLRTKLAAFATLLDQEGWEIELEFVEQSMPEFHDDAEPEFVQMWLFEGATLYRSPTLRDSELPCAFGSESAPLIQDIALPDGRAG